jgi:glycosyltransferase involved in cell wall biosynthesis
MKILIVLTYYRPHTSGLTIYAERLAKAFVERGHQVTVLTSQFDKSTPLEERVDGVKIVRVPVAFRLSKGVIMPQFGWYATRLVKEHDVVQLHLPQFDAAGIALRGRLRKKPTVITYHCDLKMPPGLVSKAANIAVLMANRLAALFTHGFVAYTEDFATHSPFLSANIKKVQVIQPPVIMPLATDNEIASFAKTHTTEEFHPIIGMATRFASEKGVEVLLKALPIVQKKYPDFKVLYAGTYLNVMGEENYFDRLYPTIEGYQKTGQWEFLGNLTPKEMASFYPNLDMICVPSLNSTESFGLVQIEAMINGTPSIASALPGVRQPVIQHKMGKVVAIGDHEDLAKAILEIADDKQAFVRNAEPIRDHYHPLQVAVKYEEYFEKLKKDLR